MKIAEFLTKSFQEREIVPGFKIASIRPRVVCKDGFNISVQASENHYCSPRITVLDGNFYTTVECGFPSEMENIPCDEETTSDMQYYAEDYENLTETVYAYVPVDVVDNLLEAHGGIDERKTFVK